MKNLYKQSNFEKKIIHYDNGCREVFPSVTNSNCIGYKQNKRFNIKIDRIKKVPEYLGLHYKVEISGFIIHNNHESNFNFVGFGKGKTEDQAISSGIGEALEKFAIFFSKRVDVFNKVYTEDKSNHLNPLEIFGYSDKQYTHRDYWNKLCSNLIVPDVFNNSISLDWTASYCLKNNKKIYVPTCYVFPHREFNNKERFFYVSNNGVASGNSTSEALLHSVYELIERDAVGLWWYTKAKYPRIDSNFINSEFFVKAKYGLKRNGYNVYLINLMNDLPIYTVAAIAYSEVDNSCLLGFGTNLNINIAIERATTEIGQNWYNKKNIHICNHYKKTTGMNFDINNMIGIDENVIKAETNESQYISDHISAVLENLFLNNIDIMAIALDNSYMPLQVVRTFSSRLVDLKPRFRLQRFYNISAIITKRRRMLTEEDLLHIPNPF